MGANTGIEWADHTLNFWVGCEPISEGCENCYAAREMKRFGQDPHVRRRVSDRTIQKTLRKAQPGDYIFVNSWSDFFDRTVPAEWREEALDLMAGRPDLIFLLLTKRSKRMRDWCNSIEDRDVDGGKALSHIWLGVTAENQEWWNSRVDNLMQTNWPGKRFVSLEPLLGPVDVDFCDAGQAIGACDQCGERIANPSCEACDGLPSIDWIICGGESGPNARPMDPDWVRSVRNQCVEADVPFFFKQWGEWAPEDVACRVDERVRRECEDEDSPVPDVPNAVWRVGKKRAGRLLDGRQWSERPVL